MIVSPVIEKEDFGLFIRCPPAMDLIHRLCHNRRHGNPDGESGCRRSPGHTADPPSTRSADTSLYCFLDENRGPLPVQRFQSVRDGKQDAPCAHSDGDTLRRSPVDCRFRHAQKCCTDGESRQVPFRIVQFVQPLPSLFIDPTTSPMQYAHRPGTARGYSRPSGATETFPPGSHRSAQ